MIEVRKTGEEEYEVVVSAEVETRHLVRLSEEDFRRLSAGGESREDLIRRSFEFLLEREPNSAILRKFDLPVIGRYFPGYEEMIREG